MNTSHDKRQRIQDALAYFFSHPLPKSEFWCQLASVADVPALLHLERYCFNPYLAFGRRRWRYLIAKSSCITVVIYHQQTLVAYLCLLPHRGWKGLEIRAVAVHWLHRNKGIGSWLLALAISLARQWHMKHLYLSVDCENEQARNMYKQLGFCVSALLADYYGLDRHGHRMRLSFRE